MCTQLAPNMLSMQSLVPPVATQRPSVHMCVKNMVHASKVPTVSGINDTPTSNTAYRWWILKMTAVAGIAIRVEYFSKRLKMCHWIRKIPTANPQFVICGNSIRWQSHCISHIYFVENNLKWRNTFIRRTETRKVMLLLVLEHIWLAFMPVSEVCGIFMGLFYVCVAQKKCALFLREFARGVVFIYEHNVV